MVVCKFPGFDFRIVRRVFFGDSTERHDVRSPGEKKCRFSLMRRIVIHLLVSECFTSVPNNMRSKTHY